PDQPDPITGLRDCTGTSAPAGRPVATAARSFVDHLEHAPGPSPAGTSKPHENSDKRERPPRAFIRALIGAMNEFHPDGRSRYWPTERSSMSSAPALRPTPMQWIMRLSGLRNLLFPPDKLDHWAAHPRAPHASAPPAGTRRKADIT